MQVGNDIDVNDGIVSVNKAGVRGDSNTPLRTEVVGSLPQNPLDGQMILLTQDDNEIEKGYYGYFDGEWV